VLTSRFTLKDQQEYVAETLASAILASLGVAGFTAKSCQTFVSAASIRAPVGDRSVSPAARSWPPKLFDRAALSMKSRLALTGRFALRAAGKASRSAVPCASPSARNLQASYPFVSIGRNAILLREARILSGDYQPRDADESGRRRCDATKDSEDDGDNESTITPGGEFSGHSTKRNRERDVRSEDRTANQRSR
jgi:hypothetical protein